MRKLQYTMPHYYSWWLKMLVWIHLHLEHWCIIYVNVAYRNLKQNKRTQPLWFKLASKLEYVLRSKVKPLTIKAKDTYYRDMIDTI